MSTLILEAPEGSFEAKWEEFVADNQLSDEVADKLKSVFYAGAAAVFEELDANAPTKNTAAAVHNSTMHFKALEAEVDAFFHEDTDIEDLTVLVVVSGDHGSTGGIAKQ